jgi:hypothetical protein
MERRADGLVLRVGGAGGGRFEVEQTSRLDSPTWSAIPFPEVGVGVATREIRLPLNAPGEAGFYRLKLVE